MKLVTQFTPLCHGLHHNGHRERRTVAEKNSGHFSRAAVRALYQLYLVTNCYCMVINCYFVLFLFYFYGYKWDRDSINGVTY